MPISLRDLQKKHAVVAVEFYDMSSDIEYDPSQLTAAFRAHYLEVARECNTSIQERRKAYLAAVREAEQDPERPVPERFDVNQAVMRADTELMLLLVKGWDITDVDGSPLPLEVEAVMDALPSPLINKISNAIWEDVGNLGKAKASTSGSKATAG